MSVFTEMNANKNVRTITEGVEKMALVNIERIFQWAIYQLIEWYFFESIYCNQLKKTFSMVKSITMLFFLNISKTMKVISIKYKIKLFNAL